MLKILMLNYEFPPLGGGAGNATQYLLKEIAGQKNIEIHLVTSSTDTYKEEQFSDKIKIYYLNINKNNDIHYQSSKELLTFSYKAYFLCQQLKKRNHYHLVHAFFGIPCGYIAMKLKLPYIISLRGSDVPFYNKRFELLDKILFKKLSQKIWKKARSVITNSQGLKELALKSAPLQKINVIYNGIDTNEFSPNQISQRIFTVISTSRLIKRKGVEYLIDGFIRFSKDKDNVQLLIIGEGNLKKELKQKVQQNNMEEKIHFYGRIEHDDLNQYYKKADIFCLPSLNEGMSNSLLEAMASGLAILATNTGGTKELVDNTNGIIIEKCNHTDIENSLNKLYYDKSLLTKMKQASRNKALKMNWEVCSQQYMAEYNRSN
ncbi:MAG: glycosyltransferase family 4 protein [Spirochaetes bacterium]|nr:glycosyltransferase family 4 protein [Spirochaetota bacterium]